MRNATVTTVLLGVVAVGAKSRWKVMLTALSATEKVVRKMSPEPRAGPLPERPVSRSSTLILAWKRPLATV